MTWGISMDNTALRALLALSIVACALIPAAPAAAQGSAEWGQPVLVEEVDTGGVAAPRVVADAGGNYTITWLQSEAGRNDVWSNSYLRDSGWIGARRIESNDSGGASDPQLAVEASGIVHAAWVQYDGVGNNIWYNRYTPGIGWGISIPLANSSLGQCSTPRIGAGPLGDVVLVFRQRVGGTENLLALTRSPLAGWSAAVPIENVTWSASTLDLAVGSDGTAVAAWIQFDGVRNGVWATRSLPGGSWENASVIETNDTYDAYDPQAAVDEEGNAMVTWLQSDGKQLSVFANRHGALSSWGAAYKVEFDDVSGAQSSQLAADGSGHFIALLQMADGVRGNLLTVRYIRGFGWEAPQPLELVADNVGGASLAVSTSGDAIVAWLQSDGIRFDVWARTYSPLGGWGAAALIEDLEVAPADSIAVAADEVAGAVAVWRMTDGTVTNLWANRNAVGIVALPFAVASPADGLITTTQTVDVTGTTLAGAAVQVNGVRAVVMPDGSFSVALALHEGINTISLAVADNRGNAKNATLTVIYRDPRVFVEENLTATRGSLNDTQHELDLTGAALEDAQRELTIAHAELTVTHADLNVTKGELTATKSSLSQTQREVSTTTLLAYLGLVLGAAAIAVGAVGVRLAKRGAKPSEPYAGPSAPRAGPAPPPPEQVYERPETYEEQLERMRREGR